MILLGAVFAAHLLDRQIFAILIPPIKVEFALSDTALGALSGLAFTIFFSTIGVAIARLADRADRARIITGSLALFSAMTAVCGLATGFWSLLLARIGVGVGEGGTNPASHSLIADLYPSAQRATAAALYSVGPHLRCSRSGSVYWAPSAHTPSAASPTPPRGPTRGARRG